MDCRGRNRNRKRENFADVSANTQCVQNELNYDGALIADESCTEQSSNILNHNASNIDFLNKQVFMFG